MNRLPLSMSSVKETAEYKAYHARVVQACVDLMGERVRRFFDEQCDYLEEFAEQLDPHEVASSQQDSL